MLIINIALISLLVIIAISHYLNTAEQTREFNAHHRQVRKQIVTRDTQRGTSKLMMKPVDTSATIYEPQSKPFDRRKYDEIMMQELAKAELVSSYHENTYTESGEIDTNYIEKILRDTEIRMQDTKPVYGSLMQRVLLANKKQKVSITESISYSVKAEDTLTCKACGYKAQSIKGLNGHMKKHRYD